METSKKKPETSQVAVPNDIMRLARIHCAKHGIKLKEFVSEAIKNMVKFDGD